LNFSKSFFIIVPPEALRCPPDLEFSRFFVAVSNRRLTPIFSDWSLVPMLIYSLFGDMKTWTLSGYFLDIMLIRGLLIENFGS